jgi:protein SMG6
MEDPTPVVPDPGPSRPPRRVDVNLADRIMQLQRKNANTNPSVPGPSRKPTPLVVPPPTSPRIRSQVPSSTILRDDEFSRGPSIPKISRQLFDPTRSNLPVHTPTITEDRTRRVRPVELPVSRRDAPVKKLFDPDVHDPHHFHPRPNGNGSEGSSRRQLSVGVTSGNGRMTEEEADRERERRRRREGSERGSTATGKKKEGDARSKGSRSSEGSESLRDRERGKNKGYVISPGWG